MTIKKNKPFLVNLIYMAVLIITFVYKYPNSISYGAMWSSNDDVIRSISFPEEVSSFEELREKFPKLFELEGELLAFTL